VVDNIRGTTPTQPITATNPSPAPINLNNVTDFGALLRNLVGDTSLPPQTQNSAFGAGMAPSPLARPSLANSLHFLTQRALPRGAMFLPARLGALANQAFNAANQTGGPSAANGAVAMSKALSAGLLAGASFGVAAKSTLSLADYPRPAADNGHGVHWIPTTGQSPDVVDKFVEKAQALGATWVTFLNKPDDLTSNDYLVKKLTAAGIMPVMRVYGDGSSPINADLKPLVQHYGQMGVTYYQLYNEPNLAEENGGQSPDVNRYVANWLPAARQVVQAGGLPGLGALSPQGEANDVTFLQSSINAIKAQGGSDVLGRAWISAHNYGDQPLHVRDYDAVARAALGRSLPIIGTEAGIYPNGKITEQDQTRIVKEAYDHMAQREPYYFSYSFWVLANKAGGGHDPRWEGQALYHPDGPSALAHALENDARAG
jgi:hypothetical protein